MGNASRTGLQEGSRTACGALQRTLGLQHLTKQLLKKRQQFGPGTRIPNARPRAVRMREADLRKFHRAWSSKEGALLTGSLNLS